MSNYQSRKLRLDQSAIIRFCLTVFLGAAALIFIIYVLDAGSWGPGLHSIDYFLMVFYTLPGLSFMILFFKTKNKSYLGMGIIFLLFTPLLYVGQSDYSDLRYLFYGIMGGLFFLVGPIRRRFNPHYRQVLELAARPINDITNGFTQRPFPAGKTEYTREEIVNFSRFLMQHWITTSYFEPQRVVLAICGFSWSYFLFGTQNFRRMTHVVFDDTGHISVNITQKDYDKFRDSLSFDQLCASLADVMTSFLQHYQNGDRKMILDLIDEEMTRSHWFFQILSNPQTRINEGRV